MNISYSDQQILLTPVSGRDVPLIKSILSQVGGRRRGLSVLIPNLGLYRYLLRTHFQLETHSGPLFQPELSKFSVTGYGGLTESQRGAVRMMVGSRFPGVLVALEPGMGKTRAALTALLASGTERVLIVTERTLIPGWQDEARAQFGIRLASYYGQSAPSEGWCLTSNETLLFSKARSYQGKWQVIVLDESTHIKNTSTKLKRALLSIRRTSGRVWCLTGIPVTKYPDDLWSQLHLIWPQAFPSYWRFADQVCELEQTPWGTRVVGAKPLNLGVLLRELVVEGANPLPVELETVIVKLSSKQGNIYKQAAEEFQIELLSGDVLSIPTRLTQIIRLLQILSNPRTVGGPDISARSDLIMSWLSQNRLEFPLLIWVHWNETGQALFERLHWLGYRVALANGQTDSLDAIRSFKSGDVDILILSLSVGARGLNLEQTRTVVFHDRTYSFEKMAQAVYRTARLSSTRPARLISLVTPGTIDDAVTLALQSAAHSLTRITPSTLASLLWRSGYL